MPPARKSRKGRAPRPHRGKRPEDAQLFILSALVLILFALLACLILTVRKADQGNPPPAPRPAQTSDTRAAEAENAHEGEAATPRGSGQEDKTLPETTAETGGEPVRHGPTETAAPARKKADAAKKEADSRAREETARKPKAETAMKPAAPPERPKRGSILIVIDDVGDNVWQLKPFLDLPFPVTFAIKPGLPFTEKARDMIDAAGKDYIIHQPMEAQDKLDPGPGALYSGMEDAKIQAILEKNFRELPGAKGMNNHEGSLVTRDLRIMRQVLRFTKSKGIPFLDSRTIGGTATKEAARLENAAYGERDVFLDNSPEKDNIIAMFKDGMKKAEKQGRAVMIGHVWSAELAQTLMELYPELVNEGYSLSTISKIVVGDEDADPGY